MSTTRLLYARALLVQGNYQTGYHPSKALVAIMASEGSAAGWNPLDTTLERHRVTPYNSFGPGGSLHVWNYPTAEEGVAATLATMAQGNMVTFHDALRERGLDAQEICEAYAQTPWSFVGNRLPLELCRAWNANPRDLEAADAALVHGAGAWPYQANGHLQG